VSPPKEKNIKANLSSAKARDILSIDKNELRCLFLATGPSETNRVPFHFRHPYTEMIVTQDPQSITNLMTVVIAYRGRSCKV